MSGLPVSNMKSKLTLNPMSYDFTVVVDGREFKSQRELLSSVSTYFDALFKSNMKETMEGRVVIHGMRSETFATVLKFILQRVTSLTADNIHDVWEAADRLDIDIYRKECEQYVINNLSLDNFSHFYQKAIDLNSKNVKDALISFMKRNFEHVYKTDTFLNLSLTLVLAFIEDEELNVETEDTVLEGILRWVSHGKHRPSTILSPDRNNKEKLEELEVEVQDPDDHFDNAIICGETGESITGIQTGDVTTNQSGDAISKSGYDDPTDDRRRYLAKLLSGAKIILASHGYLQGLLTNPYIHTCSSASDVVREALKYKVGVYPFESSLLIPYRKSFGRRNAVAFVVESHLRIYDMESRSLRSIKLENLNGYCKKDVSVVSLGSKLAFVCVKFKTDCSYVKHKCRPKVILTIDENREISTLYEACGNQNMPITLVSVNGKVLNVCHASDRSRVVDQDLFEILQLDPSVHFKFTCVFGNNILLFKNSHFFDKSNRTDYLTVNCYNTELKSLSTIEIPNVPSNSNITAIHKEKEMFLLFSSGVLFSVNRGPDNTIHFTLVNHIWKNFIWMLSGAVFYKDELLLFCLYDGVDYSTMSTSVPGLFKKISVVELNEDIDYDVVSLVPMVVPASWVEN